MHGFLFGQQRTPKPPDKTTPPLEAQVQLSIGECSTLHGWAGFEWLIAFSDAGQAAKSQYAKAGSCLNNY